VARLPSTTTPKVVELGRENDTAPLVLADTTEAVGLTDTAASETKLFNDDCMSAHSEHWGGREIRPTRTHAGSSAGSVICVTAGASAGSETCETGAGSSAGSVICVTAGASAGSEIGAGSSAGSVTWSMTLEVGAAESKEMDSMMDSTIDAVAVGTTKESKKVDSTKGWIVTAVGGHS
jgi:hypothetical protein